VGGGSPPVSRKAGGLGEENWSGQSKTEQGNEHRGSCVQKGGGGVFKERKKKATIQGKVQIKEG